jgi:hypothetical protein
MGKKLLDDNGSLREQVAFLQQQLQSTSSMAQASVEPVKDLRVEHELAQKDAEIAALQGKNASLSTQLEDALQSNAGLMRDLKGKEEALSRALLSARANDQLKDEVAKVNVALQWQHMFIAVNHPVPGPTKCANNAED